jgi:Ser/Thr protein kinase RdoA (MazF antagonist)
MLSEEILINWDISYEGIKQVYRSAWLIGDKYILKTGNKINQLKKNLSLIEALTDQGIPVAKVVKTVNGLDYVIENNEYYFISEKINGEHITDIYDGNHKDLSFMIGKVIANLHIAFRECQNKIPCYDNDFYCEIVGWVSQTFQEKNITLVSPEILNNCISELKELYPKLPRQLIHRDIHMENLLFENNILTGYIDFDLSQINARIFDLCYMTLSFLIDNVNNEDKSLKWFEILHYIVNGYNSIIPLTVDEKNAIPIMMIAIEMLFVAYFTNQNDKVCADGSATMLIWLWKNRDKVISAI